MKSVPYYLLISLDHKEWNTVPQTIRTVTTYSLFKKHIKNLLQTQQNCLH